MMSKSQLTHPRPPVLMQLPGFAISHLGRKVRGAMKSAFAREGLSTQAHFVLLCLAEYGQISQRELADLLEMDRSDLVRLLDAMEGEGDIQRRPHPGDRRRYALSVTPRGMETLERGAHLVHEATDAALARLDSDERETLHRLVLRALDVPDL